MSAAWDPIIVYGNYVEACVWAALGAIALMRRRNAWRHALGATLLVFGASDVVEAHTGAWYDPWWLLAWKAVCVGGLAMFGYKALSVGRTSIRGRHARDGDASGSLK